MAIPELAIVDEVKICPHCNQKMTCCEAPQIHVGDGLGWGSDVLFICLNDDCSLFLKGWQHIELQYGHHASYRYMELPGSKEANVMMVGNKQAFTGSVVDRDAIENQNVRYQKEKVATAALETCIEDKNLEAVLTILLDESAQRAAREMSILKLAQLNDLNCIDAIRNHTFRDTSFEQKVNMIIARILQSNFKKECPECAEIIKAQAKKCMHCQADL